MKFVLCPRCELNYMPETDKYCKVCLREMKGESPRDEVELCSICNEAPVLPGRDVCLLCLREMGGNERTSRDDEEGRDAVNPDALGDMGSMSEMDEILPDVDEDDELGEMGKELSLEAVREDEAEESEEADEEPEEI